MSTPITASMFCNLVQCSHRLNLDVRESSEDKDPESKYVELLCERGTAFKRDAYYSDAVSVF